MTTPDADPAKLPTLPPTSPAAPASIRDLPPGAGTDEQPAALGSGYLREGLIGQGANGRVWRGRRRADGQLVAIKVLRDEYSADQAVVARFVRERTVLRAVEHPHVVPVYDLVVEGDTLAIVMELVAGENLRVAAARNPFPADRAVAVLAQISGALAAVHAAGIVHRDVKPENVLVTWRGGEPWTRLTDFGVAQVADGQSLTQRSQVVGTPAYVAPELAMNRPAGPAADVYALGVLAYELLAGRRPFAGEHPMALLRAHLEDEPERPDGIAEPLWRVVRDCLAKRPEDRPSAAALADQLATLRGRTGAFPVDAPPPVPAPAPPSTLDAMPAAPTASPTTAAAVPGIRPGDVPEAGPEDMPGTGPVAVSGTGPAVAPTITPHPAGAAALPTTGATVPVPDAPPAVPDQRRRWLVPVLGLVALALVAAGAGFWAGRPEKATPGTTSTPPATTAPPLQLVHLPVTATSPAPGTIRLDFGDASTLPGFDSYVIWRDDTKIDQVSGGAAPPYLLRGVDRRTRHCYQVTALVLSTAPPPVRPRPSCLTADGRSTPNPPK